MPLPADDCTFRIAVLTALLASVGQSSGSSAVPPITNRRAAAINHVATICSRGEERNRIVAAVAGPLFANSVKITLLRDSSPKFTFPNISLSSSSVVARQEEIPRPLEATTGITSNDVAPITSNSRRSSGHNNSPTITSFKLEEHFDWEAKDLPDFSSDYLPALFASLSAGSSKEALISQFIISQCWSKIQLRWNNTEKRYYKPTRLPFRNWKLSSNERIPVGRVHIRASTAAALLKLQITVTQEGGTSYGVFDQASVHLWLRLLTTLFHTIGGTLRKGHRTREELFSLYMYLLAFDEVLRGIPATLWELRSIRHCLSDAKTAAADSTPPVLHEDEGSGVSGDEEQKVKADDDEENDNLSWIKSSDRIPAETSNFLRLMATIPMHAVAATYLCRSALFRSGISVEYTYAELPAAKPPSLDAEELETIEREILDQLCIDEKSRARLQPKVHRTVSSNAKMYEGVVHCEAAIMAALSCDDITPQSLKESFRTLRQEFETSALADQSIDIGVTKKSCPTCWFLSESIQAELDVPFRLPGRHTRFVAWVPPPWLPVAVLQNLMQRLVAVLKPLLGSTAGDAIQSATTSPTDSIFPHVDFEDFVLGMENLDLEEEAEDNSLDISVA